MRDPLMSAGQERLRSVSGTGCIQVHATRTSRRRRSGRGSLRTPGAACRSSPLLAAGWSTATHVSFRPAVFQKNEGLSPWGAPTRSPPLRVISRGLLTGLRGRSAATQNALQAGRLSRVGGQRAGNDRLNSGRTWTPRVTIHRADYGCVMADANRNAGGQRGFEAVRQPGLFVRETPSHRGDAVRVVCNA